MLLLPSFAFGARSGSERLEVGGEGGDMRLQGWNDGGGATQARGGGGASERRVRNDECERKGGVAVATSFLVQPNVVCGHAVTYLSLLQPYASFPPERTI